MKQIPSAAFRKNYAKETGPVEVTAFGRVIGTWLPVGADIDAPSIETPPVQPHPHDDGIPERMTIRPAKAPRREMVATPRVLQDPLVLRIHEHERTQERLQRQEGRRPYSRPRPSPSPD